MMCGSGNSEREASNRENNDVYSNGYERVNNGFCRKIKMCKWFKRRRKRNTPSTIESKAKTDVLHHIVVDNNLVPPVEVPSVRTPVSLRRNRGFSPARYLWRSFRPSIAPRLSNRSQEASDHVYSEGVFYNEIDELGNESRETPGISQLALPPNQPPRCPNYFKASCPNKCSASRPPNFYDTPNLDKKFSTTNSRDGFSQLATYTLENTGLVGGALGGANGTANEEPRLIHSYYGTENSANFYTCDQYTARSNNHFGGGSGGEYYESGGEAPDSYGRANPGANHVYSSIARPTGSKVKARTDTTTLSPPKSQKSLEFPRLSASKPPDTRPSTGSENWASSASVSLPNTSPPQMYESQQFIYEELEKPKVADMQYKLPPTAFSRLLSPENPPIRKDDAVSKSPSHCGDTTERELIACCSRDIVDSLPPISEPAHGSSQAIDNEDAEIDGRVSGIRIENGRGGVIGVRLEQANEVEVEINEVPSLDREAGSAHYEYAEPGEPNAWYYQRGGTLDSNNGGTVRSGVGGGGNGGQQSDSDSVYTMESGVIRYHVITMRPRLGSDGGRTLARQQDYQGRFGPYTCVHLYINEEAIRASEDNSRHLYNAVVSYRPQSRHQTMVETQNILEHLYDEPPFEGPQQQSMPHLHQISQTPSGNKVHTVHCQSSAINPTRFMEEGIGDCHPNHVRMMSDGGRPCHSSTSTLNHRTRIISPPHNLGLLRPCMCNSNNSNSNQLVGSSPEAGSSKGGKGGRSSGSGTTSSIFNFFTHLRKSSKSSQKVSNEEAVSVDLLNCSSAASPLNVSTPLISNQIAPTSPLPVPPPPHQLGSPTSSSRSSHRFNGSWVNTNPSSSSLIPMAPSPVSENHGIGNESFKPLCDNNNNMFLMRGSSRGVPVTNGPPNHNAASSVQSANIRHSIIALPSQRVSQDLMESDHYYSEVQYYQNEYEDNINSLLSSTSRPPNIYNEPLASNFDLKTSSKNLMHRRIYSEPTPRPSSSHESFQFADNCANTTTENPINGNDDDDNNSVSSCEATYDHLFERSGPSIRKGAIGGGQPASCNAAAVPSSSKAGESELRVDISRVPLRSDHRPSDYSFDYSARSTTPDIERNSSLNDTMSVRGRVSSLASHIYQEIPESSTLVLNDTSSSTSTPSRNPHSTRNSTTQSASVEIQKKDMRRR